MAGHWALRLVATRAVVMAARKERLLADQKAECWASHWAGSTDQKWAVRRAAQRVAWKDFYLAALKAE
jgi:hypothetical protein